MRNVRYARFEVFVVYERYYKSLSEVQSSCKWQKPWETKRNVKKTQVLVRFSHVTLPACMCVRAYAR